MFYQHAASFRVQDYFKMLEFHPLLMYLFASDLILHLKILQARKQRWRSWRKRTQILSPELSHQPKGTGESIVYTNHAFDLF